MPLDTGLCRASAHQVAGPFPDSALHVLVGFLRTRFWTAFLIAGGKPCYQQLSGSTPVSDKHVTGIRARVSLIAKMKSHP